MPDIIVLDSRGARHRFPDSAPPDQIAKMVRSYEEENYRDFTNQPETVNLGQEAGHRFIDPIVNTAVELPGALYNTVRHPLDTLSNMWEGAKGQLDKSREALGHALNPFELARNPQESLRQFAMAPTHAIAAAIPGFGPQIAEGIEKASVGDFAGAGGEGGSLFLQALAGKGLGEAVGVAAKSPIGRAVIGTATKPIKAAQSGLRTAAEKTMGHALGATPTVAEEFGKQTMGKEVLDRGLFPTENSITAGLNKLEAELNAKVGTMTGTVDPLDVAAVAETYVLDKGKIANRTASRVPDLNTLSDLTDATLDRKTPYTPQDLLSTKRIEGKMGFESSSLAGETNVGTLFHQGSSIAARDLLEGLAKQQGRGSVVDMLKSEQNLLGAQRAVTRSSNLKTNAFNIFKPVETAKNYVVPFAEGLTAKALNRASKTNAPTVVGRSLAKAGGTHLTFGVPSNTFETTNQRVQRLLAQALKEGRAKR